MNVLVIDDNRDKYSSIFEAFENDPENAYYFFEAPNNPGEEYLAALLEAVKSFEISTVFSLSFYQFISLACVVMQIPYVCWMVKGYEESSFDKTVKNPWNHIFCADYDTYRILSGSGINHLHYLPISYKRTVDIKTKPTKDILFVTEDIEDLDTISLQFDILKDSSKGYLDGVLLSKKVDLREKPFFESAAVYLREDVENCYPMPSDDLEPVGHKYDNRLFFPILDNKSQHIILFHITAEWNKEDYKVDVLSNKAPTLEINHKRITYYTRDSLKNGGNFDFSDYKMVIYFPNYRERNMISEEMLEILASGTVLTLPGYVCSDMLKESGAIFFHNRQELSRLITKYIYDRDASNEVIQKEMEFVKNVPTYDEILSVIANSLKE